MKKIIGILGIVALSTVVFSTNNSIPDGKTMNLDSLISLNTANAEDTGGSHTCYTITHNGDLVNLVFDCSDCRQKKADSLLKNRSSCNN